MSEPPGPGPNHSFHRNDSSPTHSPSQGPESSPIVPSSPTPGVPWAGLSPSPALVDDCRGSQSLQANNSVCPESPKNGRLKERARVRKKSEPDGTKRIRLPEAKSGKGGHRNRKEANIPVGIAVAWQRQVTTGTSSPSSTATVSTMQSQSSPVHNSKGKRTSSHSPKSRTPSSPCRRVTGSSPVFGPGQQQLLPDLSRKLSSPSRGHNHKGGMPGIPEITKSGSGDHFPVTPVSTSTATGASNVPTTMSTGLPYNYSNGYDLSSRRSPYSDSWQSQLVPQLSQSYNAAAVAYLQQQQQLSMQQQLSNVYAYNLSNYMYSGYPNDSLLQYEQFIRQQQAQDQLDRQQEQQRRLLDYELSSRGSPAPGSNMGSPRISIPSPSPNSASAASYSHHSHVWASELYHHHLTLTSSSATLSPRSLTSSTPSPITIHDPGAFLRKSLTPVPVPPNPKLSFPPPLPLVKHDRGPPDDPDARRHHDFTRPESLIERRDEESTCMLPQKRRKHKDRDSKREERKRRNSVKRKLSCDGREISVPESLALDKPKKLRSDPLEESPKYFMPLEVGRSSSYGDGSKDFQQQSLPPNDPAPGLTPVYEAVSPPPTYCDSDNVKNQNSSESTMESPGVGSNSEENSGSGLVHTFPKIVISAEESHLNLLATVAQEIGPYISMNTAQTPRRFESFNNLIQLQPVSPEAEPGLSLKDEPVIVKEEADDGDVNNVARDLENNNTVQPKEIGNPEGGLPFQLKIPQVVPRLPKETKKPKGSEIRKRPKEPKVKTERVKKPKFTRQLGESKKVPKSKKTHGQPKKEVTNIPAVSTCFPQRESPALSIYDFDFDDSKPPLEPFSINRSSNPEKYSPFKPSPSKKRLEPVMLNNSTDLNLNTPKQAPKTPGTISSSSSVSGSIIAKKARPISTVKPMKDMSYVPGPVPVPLPSSSRDEASCSLPVPLQGISPAVLEVTTSSNHKLSVPALSLALHNTDSNASSADEGQSWVADPALAVTAVKLQDSIPLSVSGPKKPRRKTTKPSKLSIEPPKAEVPGPALDSKALAQFSPKRKNGPSMKAEPIVRAEDSEDEAETQVLPEEPPVVNETAPPAPAPTERLKIRKPSIDMNIFSRRVRSVDEESKEEKRLKDKGGKSKEETWNENVVIVGVEEMEDEMRILTEIQGLFYTGKLNAIHPPDVYGVTLDNERGAPPHIIFSAEEVLEKCIREAKPWKPSQLPHGLRICAYWSPMYSGLYPGKVSTDYDTVSDLVPVEFDDGDTGVIKIGEIRLLAPNHPIREYDPNPLLTLEKKHRKRRHSSAAGSQAGCTGDHEDPDCGEAYCAKIAKLQEDDEEEDYRETHKYKYWAWNGLGVKLPKTKKNRHKEFFNGIQRGDEVINVGDSAIFISNERNEQPFLGRVERFWEKKGHKVVNVRWFYHPEEVKVKHGKRLHGLKYPGALFESPHIDENDVQTIAKKCEVIPYDEFKEKYATALSTSKTGKGHGGSGGSKKSPLKGIYYVAGYYDPYTFKLKMKDLK